jgi:hypothetical protein
VAQPGLQEKKSRNIRSGDWTEAKNPSFENGTVLRPAQRDESPEETGP